MQEKITLVAVQDGDRPHSGGGVGGDRGQHAFQPFGEHAHRGEVEQVGAGRHRAPQPRGAAVLVEGLADRHLEVEAGGDRAVPGGGDLIGPHARQPGDGTLVVLHREHDLEQRVAGQRPRGRQLLDQALERHVLMGQRPQRGLPHPGQHLTELRIPGQVGADDQGVDEEPDEVVQCLVGAAGDGGADRDVRAGAEPRQQHGDRGLHHHERRDALGAGQVHEPLVDLDRQVERHPVTAVARGGGAGTADREAQFLRRARQRLPPVGRLPGQRAVRVVLVAEQVALPERVVGVLHRQRLPRRGRAFRARRVGGGEVAGERAR
ncbi:hypothetical protein GCM10010468_70870 [Actinocorallia longicatena]|uniref:Uncharacterized protein n=1 Tax=Actinocorallia longicatena TaxID=111803 RepID=A0ABP6QM37_9ACTN